MKTLPYLAVGSNIGRMRTARLLTISQHALPGVYLPVGVYLLGGVPARGWGCTCPGEGYLLGGGVPAGRGGGGAVPAGGVPTWGV